MSTELKSDDVQKDEKEKILNNLAECLLRLERWREAENRATEVLQSSPNNEKALWRRGKARCQLLEVSLGYILDRFLYFVYGFLGRRL